MLEFHQCHKPIKILHHKDGYLAIVMVLGYLSKAVDRMLFGNLRQARNSLQRYLGESFLSYSIIFIIQSFPYRNI